MTDRHQPEPADLISAFRSAAAADPGRVSFTWLAGLSEPAGELTAGDLDDRAAAVADALLEQTAPGDRVLLVLPPGLDFVAAFLGSLYAGCVPVPVYPLVGSEDAARRVRGVIADSGAVLAWTPDASTADFTRQALGIPAYWATGAGRYRPLHAPDPVSLAFLQYTSGSTGEPRGVMVTHASLTANLTAIRTAFRHDADSVVLSWLPAYHDMGLIGNILHPLHAGCRAYLASPLDFIRRPLAWLESVARYAISTSGGPNFAYDLVVRAAGGKEVPAVDLSTWRVAYCGAEPIAQPTLARFAELLAGRGFRSDALVPCYGLAEATLLVTSAPVGAGMSTGLAPDGREAVSCGVPRDCVVAAVGGTGEPVADGAVGEILLQGPGVAAGYFNNPRASREVFGAAIPGRTGRWLRTGDLGFVAGGELFVTGRIKDVIIIRGRNHYPQDLEQLIAQACPALRPGCVAAFASAGHDGVVIVAELRDGAALAPAEQVALTAVVTGGCGVAVREIVGVPRGAVPKTTSGKLRRAECRDRYLAGCYDDYRAGPDARPGRGGDLAVVRGAVREILGTEVADDEPLAGRGMDSLGAIRLAELLTRRTGVDVPVRALLGLATPAGLLALISAGQAGTDAPGGLSETGALSKAQESLLFLHMVDPGSDEYAITVAWEPAAGTDLAALEAGLRTTVSWHPELIARITAAEPGRWRRAPSSPDRLRDALAMTPVPVPEDRLTGQLSAAAAMPFDLDAGPLLRLYRWQTPARTVYQLVVHHIATDLWSLGLVLRDVAACYAAYAAAAVPSAPAAGLSYDSYVQEQAGYLASAAARERDEELRTLLAGRNHAAGIRTDVTRPSRRDPRAGQAQAAVTVAPGALADPVATMIALWAATLGRYGAAVPVVVGVPVSGRTHGRHAAVSGLCTSTVPVVLDPRGKLPLADLVAAARRQVDQGMDASLYPLARAVEVVRPERVTGRHPLVETLITVQENPLPDVPGLLEVMGGGAADLVLGPLALRTIPVPRRSCRYDLDLVITPQPDGYRLTLDYAAGVFSPATAESILATFRASVALAASGESARLDDVLALSGRDQRLLAQIGVSATRPLDPPMLARIRRIAAEDPSRPAVQSPCGTWGYLELLDRAERIAAAVRGAAGRSGAPPAGPVALLLSAAADFTAAMLGAWIAGLGVLPLPPEYPDARLAHMLADCPPCVLLTDAGLGPRACRLASPTSVLIAAEVMAAGTAPPAWDGPQLSSDGAAFIVYTSGSTGVPKGVLIRQDQISLLAAWSEREWQLGPWARIAQTLSLGFDFGLQELFTVLPAGGCVVVPGPADRRSARTYARFLHREGVTVLFTTPSYAAEIAAAGEPLPDLRLVLLGGEVLRQPVVAGLRVLVAPECRIFNGYGPTEATVNCLMYEIPADISDAALPAVLPVGRASAASRIYLVDDADRLVPVGATGTILIGGPGVAGGYLSQPELSASRFVTLGLDPGPVYRTGDQAYVRPDGGYVVMGRTDRQVKLRGFRVELGEVEHALLSAPGVSAAVVRVLGEPGELVGFLAGAAPDAAEVTRHAASLLSPAMLPARLVTLDRLPTTANGKLDEKALAATGAAASLRVLPVSASPAEIEAVVCEIWASALCLPGVAFDANVFDLGAHSLIVTSVHGWLEASTGVTFPVHDIFEYPRPRDLARQIAQLRQLAGAGDPGMGQPAPEVKEDQ
jgi:nonribosomal peptide synthetase protein BlmVI